MSTAPKAQATTPTRIFPARPRSSVSLLIAGASLPAPVAGRGLRADALQRGVHSPELARDVAGVAPGLAEDPVGHINPLPDVLGTELVRRVLGVLQRAGDGHGRALRADQDVRRVDQGLADLVEDAGGAH